MTSPSMPAVLRPALSSVTRRTLTSVLARDRSINFCKLRTFFRSPALLAVKIRCLKRCTSRSTARHETASQSTGPPVGPFTSAEIASVSNLPSRFQRSYQVCLTGSPGPRQLPCRPGIASRIRPVMREIAGGQRLAFPVSCCLSAAGVRFLDHPVPLGISAFLAVGLPGSASCCPGPQPGFPCSARMRYDRGGCSLCPGGDGVLPARRACPDRHPPLSSGQPLHPARPFPPRRGSAVTRRQRELSVIHPSGLPLARDPWMGPGPAGFPPGSAPCRYQQRTPGRGPIIGH